MADWFAKLMHKRQPRSSRAIPPAVSKHAHVRPDDAPRDARFDVVVRMLRAREAEAREAREKRQRWYRQSLAADAGTATSASSAADPIRLHRFRTKVPCSATPEARTLLERLGNRFTGGTVTFPRLADGRQAVMLVSPDSAEPRQIGWVEHVVQTDPRLCNVRHQGLTVETDGGTMLVLRFHYPRTAVRMSARRDASAAAPPDDARRIEGRASPRREGDALALAHGATDEVVSVDFAEIRPALDPRPSDKGASPRLVWVTRPELETIDALRSRDYEAFYVRFKLEVQAAIWSALSALLSTLPASQWHQGSCYTVMREPDAASRRIHQRTVDDTGRTVDIGADRVYDAAPATDILLLYLDGDILADFADIYFSLQSLGSADAYFLKEEFFTVIRRFWAGSQSLASRYGSDAAAVLRMCQHALPMPAQAPLLKQDWTNLRQALVDRYGEGGRKAAHLAGQDVHRPRIGPLGWPFESFPAGEVNVGLRVVYRQEWRNLGAARGEVLRTVAPALTQAGSASTAITPATSADREAQPRRSVETSIEHGDATRSLDEVVSEAVEAMLDSMKWPRDLEGSIGTGVRALAASTEMGLESECRASSHETGARLSDMMRRMASEAGVAMSGALDEDLESSPSSDGENVPAQDAPTRVYSRLQNRYEVLTRPAEIQNVVLIAEKLPTPGEVDLAWVRRHDWILAKALLDESFRDALATIAQEARTPQRALELDAKRDRLYEHLRANVLHYQRAIWQQEDPQQRSMRYRKSGKRVPLDWRFELESGNAMTIDELASRLAAAQVDGQFATYSAGREVELDQLIDPAGPIGYYGNYAVYHMRPEFGSADAFSMLHFFKSPYLRPNPETGEPEVEDPVQIQIAEDPGVLAASDQVIERHRDKILQLVPELRAESGSSGSLRRHFAAYLFRRERARRLALDTDSLVIDVIRTAEPAPAKLDRADGAIDAVAEPEQHRLILAGGRAIERLSANGHRVAEAAWAIVRREGARVPELLVGAAAPDARDPIILARGGGVRMPRLIAGAGAPCTEERVILTGSDEARSRAVQIGNAHDPENERVIVARDGSAPGVTAIARAGVADGRGGEILAPNAGRIRLTAPPAAGASRVDEPLIRARADGERLPALRAGVHDPAGQVHERLILARDDRRLRLIAVAGTDVVHVHERKILARGDEWLRPSVFAR